MKTLHNHIILFDDECPMCNMYTKAFVKSGMLDDNGRASYQQMPANACPTVNRQRAVNEIALVNVQTGQVSYGIQSLFTVLGNAIPLLKPIFKFAPFVWLMSKVYAFISYNRRVIIPVAHTAQAGLQPTFRLGYRIAYLVFCWLAVGYILTGYAQLITTMVPAGYTGREYVICGAQIIFQAVVVSFYAPAQRWAYLGNMMTISLAGALLLWPVMQLAAYVNLPQWLYVMVFMGVAGLMLLEHIRRSKLLGLGWMLTISWVVYRLLVLVFIYLF